MHKHCSLEGFWRISTEVTHLSFHFDFYLAKPFKSCQWFLPRVRLDLSILTCKTSHQMTQRGFLPLDVETLPGNLALCVCASGHTGCLLQKGLRGFWKMQRRRSRQCFPWRYLQPSRPSSTAGWELYALATQVPLPPTGLQGYWYYYHYEEKWRAGCTLLVLIHF